MTRATFGRRSDSWLVACTVVCLVGRLVGWLVDLVQFQHEKRVWAALLESLPFKFLPEITHRRPHRTRGPTEYDRIDLLERST